LTTGGAHVSEFVRCTDHSSITRSVRSASRARRSKRPVGGPTAAAGESPVFPVSNAAGGSSAVPTRRVPLCGANIACLSNCRQFLHANTAEWLCGHTFTASRPALGLSNFGSAGFRHPPVDAMNCVHILQGPIGIVELLPERR
jgi:hypothetical protein